MREGAVLGSREFILGKDWEQDVICSRNAIILKLPYEKFLDLAEISGKAAAAIWKRITKRVCRDMIDSKKLSDFESFSRAGASEQDLFMELKFDLNDDMHFEDLLKGGKQVKSKTPDMYSTAHLFLCDSFKDVKEAADKKRRQEEEIKRLEEERKKKLRDEMKNMTREER